jgi:hypothetical protein
LLDVPLWPVGAEFNSVMIVEELDARMEAVLDLVRKSEVSKKINDFFLKII